MAAASSIAGALVLSPARQPHTATLTTSPDGKTFGKPKLHIATASKFNRISQRYGYRYRIEATNDN